MNKLFFATLILFIISCGKEITESIASNLQSDSMAPWRETRGKIVSNASVKEKDQFCVKEFGPNYEAGSYNEMRILTHTGEYSYGWSSYREGANLPGYSELGGIIVSDSKYAISSTVHEFEQEKSPISARVFCIRK